MTKDAEYQWLETGCVNIFEAVCNLIMAFVMAFVKLFVALLAIVVYVLRPKNKE